MDRRQRLHREFDEDLQAAFACSERAFNALHAEHGPKRSLWFRLLLGRARSILRSLAEQEIREREA